MTDYICCVKNTAASAIAAITNTTQSKINVFLLVFFLAAGAGAALVFIIGLSTVAGSVNATLGVRGCAEAGTDTALPIEPGTGAAATNGALSSASTGSGAGVGSGTAIGVVASIIGFDAIGFGAPGVNTGATGFGLIGATGSTGGTGAAGAAGATGATGAIGSTAGGVTGAAGATGF